MGFQDITGNFLWLALFIFAGAAWIVSIQVSNEAVQPIAEDSLFNDSFQSLQTSLSELETEGTTQYDQFTGETPKPGFGSIVLFGIVGAGKTFSNIIIATFWILLKVPLIVLGIPQTIISVLATWLIITIIVAVWLLYKLGG